MVNWFSTNVQGNIMNTIIIFSKLCHNDCLPRAKNEPQPYIKINSKWVDINIKPKNFKLLGESLCDLN